MGSDRGPRTGGGLFTEDATGVNAVETGDPGQAHVWVFWLSTVLVHGCGEMGARVDLEKELRVSYQDQGNLGYIKRRRDASTFVDWGDGPYHISQCDV
jgi:hypothetical protein